MNIKHKQGHPFKLNVWTFTREACCWLAAWLIMLRLSALVFLAFTFYEIENKLSVIDFKERYSDTPLF